MKYSNRVLFQSIYKCTRWMRGRSVQYSIVYCHASWSRPYVSQNSYSPFVSIECPLLTESSRSTYYLLWEQNCWKMTQSANKKFVATISRITVNLFKLSWKRVSTRFKKWKETRSPLLTFQVFPSRCCNDLKEG